MAEAKAETIPEDPRSTSMAVQVDVRALADELLPANDFDELLHSLEGPRGLAEPGALPSDFDLGALLAEKAVPAEKAQHFSRPKSELRTRIRNAGSTSAWDGAENLAEIESYISDEDTKFPLLEEIEQCLKDNFTDKGTAEESEATEESHYDASWKDFFIPVTESALAPKELPEDEDLYSLESEPFVEFNEECGVTNLEEQETKRRSEPAEGLSGKELLAFKKRRYRALKIKKWLKKRRKRNWKKEALYDSRVDAAKRRPRSKGKFLKQEITWVPAPTVFK